MRGIEQDDRSKIKQIVLEIQDIKDRINQIKSLLESQKFRVIVEHNNLVPDSLKYLIYMLSEMTIAELVDSVRVLSFAYPF
ncbi:MAG: hypothetical protein CLLPBCKN_006351 [Chroococcidiopsis cubana SAG 39.79]|uniref:Uncharacterized protein n=1 Tax=Chroococcidiopsis cubana SAG 39.79 TaxID=388085 RepID=A0AB37UAS6_9CYAN|nr:hypothetical protein [Chroococcidiopsis cubana SAG 39.79]PSB54788.1 hypothetical protein C7B79_34375 [Chroococcidiopsis cubana CCALA 043]RUT03360.1 hypothetical protein DSM107010_60470 [Chroococcidiopsis cubana SAG 39.79]